VENADRTRISVQILGILLPNRIAIPVKLLGIAQEEGSWSGLEARGRPIAEEKADKTRIPVQILGILSPNRFAIPVMLLGIAQEEGSW